MRLEAGSGGAGGTTGASAPVGGGTGGQARDPREDARARDSREAAYHMGVPDDGRRAQLLNQPNTSQGYHQSSRHRASRERAVPASPEEYRARAASSGAMPAGSRDMAQRGVSREAGGAQYPTNARVSSSNGVGTVVDPKLSYRTRN